MGASDWRTRKEKNLDSRIEYSAYQLMQGPFFGTLLSFFLLVITVALPSADAEALSDSVGLSQPGNLIITWDGQNGIAVNALVGADRFYNVGVFGQSTVTANVEAGLTWNGHEITTTLNDFYYSPDAAGEFDAHATAVGSVIAGYDPTVTGSYPYYKLGMAPLTQLSSGAIATNEVDPISQQTNTYFNITAKTFYSAYNHYFTTPQTHSVNLGGGITATFSGPTDVINSSWGYSDPTAQDPYTMAADSLSRANAQTTFVVAAGNSTTAANSSNNVGGPASGFNSISVGAVGNGTYDQFSSIAEFSSRGPQDYYDSLHGLVKSVRAPVDIVAPGTSLAAAYYGGQTGGNGSALSTTIPDLTSGTNNLYSLGLAGTSFAAPIVAGGVSLLKSLSYLADMSIESRDTRVIKSVLMNSATKLPGWDNGQHADTNGVIVTTQALDWAQGAGMLNLNQAFDQYYSGTKDVPGTGGGQISELGWDFGSIAMSLEGTAHNDYPISVSLLSNTTINITLSWFRNYTTPEFTDNPDPMLQSLTTEDLGLANLNLEIWNADFTQLYATSMTEYNSVQHLHYTLPTDGLYGIRVTYPSQMSGEAVAESYGLAWSVESVAQVPEPGPLKLFGVVLLVAAGARGIRKHSRWKYSN